MHYLILLFLQFEENTQLTNLLSGFNVEFVMPPPWHLIVSDIYRVRVFYQNKMKEDRKSTHTA